jgi:hypothetical protein
MFQFYVNIQISDFLDFDKNSSDVFTFKLY